jgi:predicted DCC family thiol-disulfide oxidoreductase YuxK
MADQEKAIEARDEGRENPSRALVLFDGNCALCNHSVLFLLEHDRFGTLRFAPLDSETGRRVVGAPEIPSGEPGSIVVVDGRKFLRESDAVLLLTRHLRFPWNLLGAARIVPQGIRDVVYRFVARHRLRWFGTTDGCSLMRSAWKDRFVDERKAPIFPP